jgi:membrane protein
VLDNGCDRGDDRSHAADGARDLPLQGFRDVVRRVRRAARDDNLTLIAAGVAFFVMLSVVPGLAALVAVYGLVFDPADIARQVDELGAPVPDEARSLLREQLSELAAADAARLGLGFVVGLALSFWVASTAVSHLLVAVTAAYGERSDWGYVRRRVAALPLTVAAVAYVIVVMAVLTGLPGWVGDLVGPTGRVAASVLRWPLLAASMLLALAVIYRVGPERAQPGWRWVSWGAVVAVVLWLLTSAGFSLYVANLASYDRIHGALGGVVVFMLWVFISVVCVLLGAEVNAVLDDQSTRKRSG